MLAGRYLRTRRRKGFVSVIAGFSFLGIMLGVMTLIVVLSVLNGFRKELLDKIVGLNGHIFVTAIETPMTDYDAVAKRIAAVPGVQLVNTAEYFCDNKFCSMNRDEALFYRDESHLNDVGSRFLADRMLTEFPRLREATQA